jgi:hypothetical protein
VILHLVVSPAPGGGYRASCEGDGVRVVGLVRIDRKDAAAEAVETWEAQHDYRERRREEDTRRLG